MVTVNAQFGGREYAVATLAAALRARGLTAAVAGAEGPCAAAFEARGVPVVRGGLGGFPWRPGAWAGLSAAIRDFAPDVVHGFESEIAVPARVVAALARVPGRVSTVLTPWVLRLEGRRWLGRLRLRGIRLAERLTQGLAQRVLAISDAVASDYTAGGLRAETVYLTVPPRAPAPLDLTAEFGVPPGRRVLVAAGRAVDRKGLPDLVEALGRLVDAGHDAHLLHVGDDPSGGRNAARYREAAAARGVADRLTLAGRWDGEVVDLLAAGAVAAMPSYSEGLGLVLVEALLAGVPSVAYAVGGTVDVVRDGETGWLVPRGDRAGFAAALARALDLDGAGRAALAARGAAWYRERFDLDRMVDAHVAAYEAACAGGAPR